MESRSALGGVGGYQVDSENSSSPKESSAGICGLWEPPSPLWGWSSVGIRSAGKHQMSLHGTRSLEGHFTGYPCEVSLGATGFPRHGFTGYQVPSGILGGFGEYQASWRNQRVV